LHDRQEGDLYPLQLSMAPKDRVWGGSRLARMVRAGPSAGQRIGEVWSIWDELTVQNGVFRGRILADLVRSHPLPLLGSRIASLSTPLSASLRGLSSDQPPLFPLLVKLIDAQDTLSVQVHPDDDYARRTEGQAFGKAELWVVLDAEPGARLIHGVKRPISRSDAQEAIWAGAFQDMLEYVDVAAGDVIFNPPGTIHALGSGLLVYELQQSSDLTYRLYDWNRNDPNRELHVQKALDVANLVPVANHTIEPVAIQEPGATRTFLCACGRFAAEMLRVDSQVVERPSGFCFHILTILQGIGAVQPNLGSARGLLVSAGESVLVPAGIHQYSIQAEDNPLVVIKSYVPDLLQDVVQPLRERGVADAKILQLGVNATTSGLAL